MSMNYKKLLLITVELIEARLYIKGQTASLLILYSTQHSACVSKSTRYPSGDVHNGVTTTTQSAVQSWEK